MRVRIEGVSKRFGAGADHLLALDTITLSVASGEFVAILGPSGCGKSTLLRIVAGLVGQSSGRVLVGDEPVRGPSDHIAMVFQSPALLPWRTVLPNIELPVELKRLPRPPHRQRALELVKLVGLEGFEDRYPYQLSGGMQQRVSLCRALVCDPRIVLMDEPFGALDAITRDQMNTELQRIWLETRTTAIFVTHSIPEAIFLADRVVVMTARPGKVKAIIDVDLPRPRSADVKRSVAFIDRCEAIAQLVREEALVTPAHAPGLARA